MRSQGLHENISDIYHLIYIMIVSWYFKVKISQKYQQKYETVFTIIYLLLCFILCQGMQLWKRRLLAPKEGPSLQPKVKVSLLIQRESSSFKVAKAEKMAAVKRWWWHRSAWMHRGRQVCWRDLDTMSGLQALDTWGLYRRWCDWCLFCMSQLWIRWSSLSSTICASL